MKTLKSQTFEMFPGTCFYDEFSSHFDKVEINSNTFVDIKVTSEGSCLKIYINPHFKYSSK